jgi:hypothetical protein
LSGSVSLGALVAAPSAGVLAQSSAPTIDGFASGELDAMHGTLVRYFEESEDQSYDARQLSEKCRDYYDGRQYTSDEIALLRRRRQAPVINNYVKRKVELLRGLERRGRSDPKAFPRTPDEDNRADAATQALRYVADDQRYDVVRSSVFDNILIEGVGGCEVIVEPDRLNGGYNIVINHIPWDRLFWDPHSRHPGFTDARYLGCVIWADREDLLDDYPGCDDVLDAAFENGGRDETYQDRPTRMWTDSRRRRLRVVQIWWTRRREWWSATFTKGGFLEPPARSPYLDRHGLGACPLILRSAYCDRDLNRYGVVRDLISQQDSINKRETKLAHSLAVNRIVAEAGAVDNEDKARNEAAKPDGFVLVNPGKELRIEKDSAEIAGQFQLLQYAVAQMNVSGPNAAMAGKDPRTQSGRAILAQQAGGQVEHEPIADALRQHTHKVFEATWMRIKQFKTAEWWVRVTDNDKNVSFVGMNHPITLMDLVRKVDPTVPIETQLRGLPDLDARATMLGLQLRPGDPRLAMVVRIENEVSDIDVDIDIEEGPDSPTLQDEQFSAIMQLPPQILMQFPPEFIIQASSLRNKDQLVKMIEDHRNSQMATQQQAQALAQAQAQANVEKTQAEAADRRAQAVERVHGVSLDHSGLGDATPQNAMLDQASSAPPPVDPLALQAQAHTQAMDRAKLGLVADQQQHDQTMDVASHALALHQALQPPAPPAGAGAGP